MGGRIWIESEVGKGSTFFFTARFEVPADQSAPQIVEETSAGAGIERRLAGLRILLADDSDDNRFLILTYLKGMGCSIDIAENGEIAANKFRSGVYDLVLMDCEMPVMDGYSATREIRRFEKETGRPATPVLALTAHAFAEMAAKSLEAGFTAHLTKPIRKATLLAELARHAPVKDGVQVEGGLQMGGGLQAAPGFSQAPESAVKASRETTLRVTVEPGMEDVVPGYLEKRRDEIPAYRQALASADFPAIRMLGHKMKGTGAGYGFTELTKLGEKIENAALAGDRDTASATVDQLERYLSTVELDYGR